MIARGPPDRATQQKTAIPTTQIDDDRRTPSKEGRPIEHAFGGQVLEGRLRPTRRLEDFSGYWYTKFPFYVPAFLHEPYFTAGVKLDRLRVWATFRKARARSYNAACGESMPWRNKVPVQYVRARARAPIPIMNEISETRQPSAWALMLGFGVLYVSWGTTYLPTAPGSPR